MEPIVANIGMTQKQKKDSSLILQKLLANQYLLYTKTRNYHWNIEGPSFLQMHEFYERLYTELEEGFDEVAERIRQLGHYSEGRLKDFLKITDLEEQDYPNHQTEQITNLLNDHETIIRRLRGDVDKLTDDIKDSGTADFVTGMMEKHEQWAWFLRSYLR